VWPCPWSWAPSSFLLKWQEGYGVRFGAPVGQRRSWEGKSAGVTSWTAGGENSLHGGGVKDDEGGWCILGVTAFGCREESPVLLSGKDTLFALFKLPHVIQWDTITIHLRVVAVCVQFDVVSMTTRKLSALWLTAYLSNFTFRAPESLSNHKKNFDLPRTVHNPKRLIQNKWFFAANNATGPTKSPLHHLQATVRRRSIWNNYKYKNMEKEDSRPSLPLGLAGKDEGLHS
jgi:hypothetical protein